MSFARMKERLGRGEEVLSAWIALPEPLVVETFARSGFDAVTLDAQHGLHDEASLRLGLERAALLGVPGFVRLPVEGRALASRVLDSGATGVVMPMIETAADAAAFVAEAKYPPLGRRSFGPNRAVELHGFSKATDYVEAARQSSLAFAMIETASALYELEAILAVDGLDGVFVGPSDLSIALSPDGVLDPHSASVRTALEQVLRSCEKAGKIAAIYAITAEDAVQYRQLGFPFICVGSDVGVLKTGASELARSARSAR